MNAEDPNNEKVKEEKSALGKPFPLKFVILAVLIYIFAFNLYLWWNS